MLNTDTMVTLPLAQLQSIRRALKAVMDTHRGSSVAAAAARDAGYAAYRTAFSAGERSRVMEHARKVQRDAPAGHFLRRLPEITSFEQALDDMGTQLIDAALGDEARP